MEPRDNKQLALQKAISSHEQAAAGLADLMGEESDESFVAMMERIKQNIAELHAHTVDSKPGDVV